MNPVLFVVLLTAATGVGGLALGGGLAALIKRESPRGTSLLLSFTAGLMLSIVALDMVPEAVEALEGGAAPLLLVPGVLVAGFVVTYLLNCWIDKSAHHEDAEHPHACACGHHDLHTAGLVLACTALLGRAPLVPLVVACLMALYGIAGAYQPTVQASIPLLAEEERLTAANAVISMVSTLSGLLGPVVGGVLFGAFGIRPILWVSAGCFFLSAVMELFIRIPHQPRAGAGGVLATVGWDLGES